MPSLRLGFALLAATGCGRWGFDEGARPDAAASPDASPSPDGEIASATLLPCGQPTRFAINGSNASALAATGTTTGFAVFAAEGGQHVGWSFDWNTASSVLLPTAQHISLGTETRDVLGATAVGADVIATSVVGLAAPTGTKLTPLGSAMTMRGPAVSRTEIAADHAIATSGTGDALALATVDATTTQIDAYALDALGATDGIAHLIAPPAELANSVTLAPAGTGYLATWTSRAASPNPQRIALVDHDLAVVAGPVTTNNTTFDAMRGHAAWASRSNRYLIAWFEKNASDSDDVWFQIRGPNLEPITPPRLLVTDAYAPMVASDGTAFWVAWLDIKTAPERLAAARVSDDGTVTPRRVSHAGGMPKLATMVTRAGQPVLVWTEIGATGPDLYFDPMCP